jgi:Ca-activated chloride channel family protein
VFCLDYSGSMRANGKEELEEAMATLLDQNLAKEIFLQRTPRDVTVVLPFAKSVLDEFGVTGNNPDDLQGMLAHIKATEAGGGTGIYGCLADALDWFESEEEEYASAIVLMTDGDSNEGSLEDFASKLPADPTAIVPVYSILFGDASTDELEEITELTNGNIYDGRDGLVKAMRDAFANA